MDKDYSSYKPSEYGISRGASGKACGRIEHNDIYTLSLPAPHAQIDKAIPLFIYGRNP